MDQLFGATGLLFTSGRDLVIALKGGRVPHPLQADAVRMGMPGVLGPYRPLPRAGAVTV